MNSISRVNQLCSKREGHASKRSIVFLLTPPFISELLGSAAHTWEWVFPRQLRSLIRITCQLRLPNQAILICGKLTLKLTITLS